MTITARKRLIAMAAEFLKAFPMLEDVLIESWQEGAGVGNPYSSTLPSRTYGLPHSAARRVIECANRSCKGGGFDILQDISSCAVRGDRPRRPDWRLQSLPVGCTMRTVVRVGDGNPGSDVRPPVTARKPHRSNPHPPASWRTGRCKRMSRQRGAQCVLRLLFACCCCRLFC